MLQKYAFSAAVAAVLAVSMVSPSLGATEAQGVKVSTKSLNKATNNAGSLSKGEIAAVISLTNLSGAGDVLRCTALNFSKATVVEKSRASKKARNACAEAKKKFPFIATRLDAKLTTKKAQGGQILLTFELKSRIMAPLPSPRPIFTPEPRPFVEPNVTGQVSEAQKSVWRELINSYQQKIASFRTNIVNLQSSLTIEQVKLDNAVQYGDLLRKGIQESTISSINSEIESWASDIAFYQSLIGTYQSRIDQVARIQVPAGPTQSQIDSWNRLINIYQSSMSFNNSRISAIEADLRKFTYWSSVAQRYGDEGRVSELVIKIADANAEISTLKSENAAYSLSIDELRGKIAS